MKGVYGPPAECPRCHGYGSTVTALPHGGRLVVSCRDCLGTGVAEVDKERPIPLRDEETCAEKRTYATRGRAARAVSELRKRGMLVDHPYKCKVCGFFHLTTNRKRKGGRPVNATLSAQEEE